MTFDEAITDIDNNYDYSIDKYTVIDILENLRQEYAPTVEMTEEQYKIFNDDMQLNQQAMDDYIDEKIGLPEMTNRQFLYLYTHPETIKVIGEEHDN